jgi:hypothetical protein
MRFPESEERLRKMHTRQLLLFLDKARIVSHFDHGYCFAGEPNYAPKECWTCAADLKEILATREHIPNKAERKKMRAKATGIEKKRGRAWVKFNDKKA